MKCPFKPIKEIEISANRFASNDDTMKTFQTEKVTDFGECDKDCVAYKECCCTLTKR